MTHFHPWADFRRLLTGLRDAAAVLDADLAWRIIRTFARLQWAAVQAEVVAWRTREAK